MICSSMCVQYYFMIMLVILWMVMGVFEIDKVVILNVCFLDVIIIIVIQ